MSSTIQPTAAAESLNPFGNRTPSVAGAEAENGRAIAEAQAAILIAQRFPRDQVAAMDRILQAFTRPALAEGATYCYARGGTDVTGPSIRAAEAIAQNWGNFQFGVRELEQRRGESTVEAFAWDVETNTRSVTIFQVPHVRDTKRGRHPVTDARDIYEVVANQGARRVRARILSIIPGDVVEAAMKQAETTLATKVAITPERIQSLAEKFAEIGVSRQAIEKRIQRRLEAITPALMVKLGTIFTSVKDGMSVASDWFELAPSGGSVTPIGGVADRVKAQLAQNAQPVDSTTSAGASEQSTGPAIEDEAAQDGTAVVEATGAAVADTEIANLKSDEVGEPKTSATPAWATAAERGVAAASDTWLRTTRVLATEKGFSDEDALLAFVRQIVHPDVQQLEDLAELEIKAVHNAVLKTRGRKKSS